MKTKTRYNDDVQGSVNEEILQKLPSIDHSKVDNLWKMFTEGQLETKAERQKRLIREVRNKRVSKNNSTLSHSSRGTSARKRNENTFMTGLNTRVDTSVPSVQLEEDEEGYRS